MSLSSLTSFYAVVAVQVSDDDASVTIIKSKYQKVSAITALVDSDSGQQEEDSPLQETQRLKRSHTRHKALMTAVRGGRALSIRSGSCGSSEPHTRCKAQTPTVSDGGTLNMRSGSCGSSGSHRPKRKRWGNSVNSHEWGCDNLGHRLAEQHQHVTEGQADTLWTSLQQLDPRRTQLD